MGVSISGVNFDLSHDRGCVGMGSTAKACSVLLCVALTMCVCLLWCRFQLVDIR